MSSVAITHGCTLSLLAEADLPELMDLIAAIEHVDEIANPHSPIELTDQFHRVGAEPELNAVVIRQESGNLVAYGWNQVPDPSGASRAITMIGGCHPAWRNRGLGSLLVAWLQQRAVAWYDEYFRDEVEPLTVIAKTEALVTSDDDLLRNNGFELRLRSVDVFCRLDARPSEVRPPAGIVLEPLTLDRLPEVRGVHESAHWTQPTREVDWSLAETDFIGQSWVAVRRDSVVGYVCNSLDAESGLGWTEVLGVDPDRQGEGIGRSLLKCSLQQFFDEGLVGAGMNIEGPGTMTIDVFRSLGYQPTGQLLTYVWSPPGA